MTLRRASTALAIAAVVVSLWYLGAWLVQSADDVRGVAKLPYLHQIVDLIVGNRAELTQASWVSIRQALIGFVVGAGAGAFLSIVMAQAKWAEAGLLPYLLASQMVPMLVIVPLAQNILQNDDLTRVFIASFVTFFSVSIATLRGLQSATPEAHELMRSYHAGRLATLRYLQVPSALPMLFTGLRVAAPLSLVGAVVVDLSGAQAGLGYLMVAGTSFGTQGALLIWAATLILLGFGLLLAQAVALGERALVPWADREVGQP